MLRLLLIDDNPHDRLLAIRSLERELTNIQIQEIINTDELAQVLEAGNFDLVITDYQLRWSDGLAVLHQMKAKYPECPVIMFTNSGSEEIAVEAMKSGLDDYVMKSPNHYMRLATAVRSAWEKAKAQRKAVGLENRLQRLLNQLNVGVFHVAADGSLLEANLAFLRLLGLSQETDSLAIQTLEPYFHPADYAQFLHQQQESGQTQERDVQLRRADGQFIWVRLSQRVSTIEGQTIIEGLIEDISDVYNELHLRKQTEAALQNALQKLNFHVENTPLAVIERDSNFRITRWSKSAEKIFGWTAEDVRGQDWQTGYGEDVETVKAVRKRIVNGEEKQNVLQLCSYTKDGAIINCEWYNSALFDESGKLVSILSLVLDVTERKRAEAERTRLLQLEQDARSAAEAANRIKDEFLAVLSHELRSPLNPILGWTKLLRSRKFDQATLDKALETIERNAQLQTQLIEDLLDISRIIRGKLSLNICPVDLAATIEAALDTVRLAAQAKSIQLESLIDPRVGIISGDPNRLQQVVWNLLSNAIKFTPSGGRVTITLKRQGNNAELQVRDTGKGISADFLPHVFDYFRQADSSTTRTHGGLGLGLAIVRHLVELHGGTVGVSSSGMGQGATFSVALPLLEGDRDLAEENREAVSHTPCGAQEPGGYFHSPLKGKRILIVDDEADAREYYTTVLEECGASVTTVESAREALKALEQQRPDILISDIGMPYEDGYTLIRQVRASHGEQLPAIALTAYAGAVDQQLAITAGFHKHLPKPVAPEDLVDVVTNLLDL